jgi:hypothetical protein
MPPRQVLPRTLNSIHIGAVKSMQEKKDPENGAITGADVSIGFLAGPVAPGDDGTGAVALEQTVTFQGFLHASFQGLAQSLDETSENPDLEVTG